MDITDPLPSEAEAMILPLGAPMEPRFATFEGSLADARILVKTATVIERKQMVIWTPGHIFGAADLLAEDPGHEHDPLA